MDVKAVIFDWGRTIYDKDNEVLFPETIDVLEYCSKKYDLAVVSLAIDGDIEGRFQKLDRFDIRKYFKLCLFSDTHESFIAQDASREEVEKVKFAQKDMLMRNAVGNLNYKPEEIVLVDDRILRMAWAIRNKIKTIWIKKGKFAHETPDPNIGNPDYTVSSLKEIMDII